MTKPGTRKLRAGKYYVTYPGSASFTASAMTPPKSVSYDWHVLVLYADDTESDIKGIWGPYTSADIAASALDELRQWPLDGRWDMRRLNKFVAAKSGNAPDQLARWTWQ